jgi:Mce-associated membrane protein
MAAAVPEVGASTRGTYLTVGSCVALALALVALIVVGFVRHDQTHASGDFIAADTPAVEAANQIVVGLTSMTAATGDADVARLLKSATGSFHAQFEKQTTTFEQVLKQSAVSSVGQVVEAGVVSSDGTHVVVLSAVTATVKNTASPSGEQRVYRMLVSMQRVGKRWLVSDLEFVP